jgi:hypothetical protein
MLWDIIDSIIFMVGFAVVAVMLAAAISSAIVLMVACVG